MTQPEDLQGGRSRPKIPIMPESIRALYRTPIPHQEWPVYQLTAEAIAKGELEHLLLGDKGYAYIDRHSLGDGPTDLYAIYSVGIITYARDHPELDIKGMIEQLIPKLSKS